MKKRKILLNLSKKVANSSVQEAISLVLSIIQSAEEESQNKNLYKDELLDYLYIARNNLNAFIEFNNAQAEIKKLLDDILCLTNENGKIIIKNKNYSSLSLEELKYVMGWARRISVSVEYKENKETIHSNENLIKNKRRNNSNNYSKNIDNDCIDERWAVLQNFKL